METKKQLNFLTNLVRYAILNGLLETLQISVSSSEEWELQGVFYMIILKSCDCTWSMVDDSREIWFPFSCCTFTQFLPVCPHVTPDCFPHLQQESRVNARWLGNTNEDILYLQSTSQCTKSVHSCTLRVSGRKKWKGDTWGLIFTFWASAHRRTNPEFFTFI